MTAPRLLAGGKAAEYSRTITAADIANLAAVSGEDPAYVDEDCARGTVISRTLAHGARVMPLLSTTGRVNSRRSVARGAAGTPDPA